MKNTQNWNRIWEGVGNTQEKYLEWTNQNHPLGLQRSSLSPRICHDLYKPCIELCCITCCRRRHCACAESVTSTQLQESYLLTNHRLVKDCRWHPPGTKFASKFLILLEIGNLSLPHVKFSVTSAVAQCLDRLSFLSSCVVCKRHDLHQINQILSWIGPYVSQGSK